MFFGGSSTLVQVIFHAFRADFKMDETCATGSGECSPHQSITPCAVILDTSGLEASTSYAANKTTRYHICKHKFYG